MNIIAKNLTAELKKAFGPERADLIMECVGTNTTIDQAVVNARKGTDIIVVGVFEEKASVDLGLLQDRELRLIGTLMYQRPDFEKAIELIETGSVSLDPLISDYFDFTDYSKAYLHIEKNKEKSLKVFIKGRMS